MFSLIRSIKQWLSKERKQVSFSRQPKIVSGGPFLVEEEGVAWEELVRERISQGHHSTRTLTPFFRKAHHGLSQKYRWYHQWHMWRFASLAHVTILLLAVLVGTTVGLKLSVLQNPVQSIHAASACVSNGTGGGNWSSASSWNSCGGTYPQSADTAEILGGDTITLDIDLSVSGLQINASGEFNGGSSTLNFVASGTPFVKSGTFNPNSGTIRYSGEGDTTITAANYHNLETAPTASGGDGWIVSGAGETAYNGTYTASGTHNGQPQYTDGTHWLYLNDESMSGSGPYSWTLNPSVSDCGDPFMCTIYHTGSGDTTLPGTWYTSYEQTDPAPTLATAPITYTFAAGTFNIAGNYISGDGTHEYTITADTNDPAFFISGSFANSANSTFIASNSGTLSVADNWNNSGTFTHSSGTVTLYTSQTITGETTFNNLSLTNATSIFSFATGSTQTISGTLTVTGEPSANITLARSGGSGTDQWNITPTAVSISYVTIENSNNTTGVGMDSANTTDGGNNTNWFSAPSAPTAPSGVSIGSIDTTAFTVSWNDNSSDETGFKVYISTTAAADCSTATYPGAADYTAAANATSQTFTSKAINTQYCAKVIATNGSSDSSAAYASPKYTLAAMPSLSSVTANYSDANSYYLDLTINTNSNPAGTYFYLQYSTNNSTFSDPYAMTWQTSSSYAFTKDSSNTSLLPNTQYWLKVKAKNGDGVSTSYSSSLADVTPPAAPTNLATSNICSASALTSWTAATGANTYSFSYGTDSSASNIGSTDSISTTSKSLSSLSDGAVYYWKVKSVSSANGAGPYATPVSFTTSSCLSKPLAPTDFRGTPISTSEISWRWSDSSKSETGWKVFDVLGTNLSGTLAANSTSWNETGLSVNTAYTCLVNIFSSGGNNNSNQATVYTLANIPGTPTLTETGSGQAKVKINKNDNPEDITRYAVAVSSDNKTWSYIKNADYATQSNPDWQLYTDWGGEEGFTQINLTSSTTYTYKIKAKNGDGVETDFSPTATIKLKETQAETQVSTAQTTSSAGFVASIKNTWSQLKAKPTETASASAAAALVVATVAAAAAPVASALTLLSLPEFAKSFLFLLLSTVKPKKKKQGWGKVTESGTGVAIPQVRVDLVKLEKTISGDQSRKIVQTVYSDKDGEYAFIAPIGQYALDVHKDMYNAISSPGAYQPDSVIDVNDVANSLVAPNIVLDIKEGVAEEKASMIRKSDVLEKVLRSFSYACLLFGSYIAISGLVSNPRNVVSIIIVAAYPYLWYFNLRAGKKVSPFGDVIDKADAQGVPLTLIRIMDEAGKKMVKTAVTDKEGHFQALLSRGDYKMLAAKTGYRQTAPQIISANEDLNVISKKIELERGTNIPTTPPPPPPPPVAAPPAPASS